jgi:hypothetical protein
VIPRYCEDVERKGDFPAKIQAIRAYGNSKAIARVRVDYRLQRPEITLVFNAEGSPNKRVYISTESRRNIRTEFTSVQTGKRKSIRSEARKNMKLERIQYKSVGTPIKQECETTVGLDIRSEARKNMKLERIQSKSVGTPIKQECGTTVGLVLDNAGRNDLRANMVEMIEICFSKLVLK